MPAKHSCHVVLTNPIAIWAEQQVTKGDYPLISDLACPALQLLKRDTKAAGRPAPAFSEGGNEAATRD